MKCKIVLTFVVVVFIFLLIAVTRSIQPTPRTDRSQMLKTITSGESDLIGSDEPRPGLLAHLKGSGPVQEKGGIRCPESPVAAVVGQDLTLDCHLEPEHDVTKELFEWMFDKNDPVLVHKSRAFSAVDQAEQFRDRASLDSSGDLTKGKIPVMIPSVREDDAGMYRCSVGSGRQRISCFIQVTVGPKEQPTDPGKTPAKVQSKAPDRNGATLALALVTSTFLCLLYY
ncbi:butyrophilin-like protein 2 [Pagrus major]|uniref:butyrophilin-like protein 2 n=1 Tax=Pagrus major TaxID=143350 RepID=UPI003CC8DA93